MSGRGNVYGSDPMLNMDRIGARLTQIGCRLGSMKPDGTPKTRPLKGRVGYWIREFGDTGERSLGPIVSNLQQLGGGDCVCLKVADGLSWVGSYDSATPINSLADLKAIRDQCAALDCAFLPVVVPRGVAGEAEFHAQIAEECGALMVDIEPYAGAAGLPVPITFWDHADHTLIPVYWQALRSAAPDAYLMAQPDPRSYGWTAGYLEQSLSYFDALCCQHYVGWVSAGWLDVAAEVASVRHILTLGKDVYVTLYGADPAYPLQNQAPSQFWQQVQPLVLGLCVFAFGPMNANQLRAIAALPGPAVDVDPVPQPTPPTPPDPQPTPPTPPDPQPTPPTPDDRTLREQIALWSGWNITDLLDPDVTDADALQRVHDTAAGIVQLTEHGGSV